MAMTIFRDKCKRLRSDGPTPCWCCPGECFGDKMTELGRIADDFNIGLHDVCGLAKQIELSDRYCYEVPLYGAIYDVLHPRHVQIAEGSVKKNLNPPPTSARPSAPKSQAAPKAPTMRFIDDEESDLLIAAALWLGKHTEKLDGVLATMIPPQCLAAFNRAVRNYNQREDGQKVIADG